MSEKMYGVTASTLCGALTGFVLCFAMFSLQEAGSLVFDPALFAIGMIGAVFFGVAGLGSGVALALCRGLLGSSYIAHALVGSLAGTCILVMFGQMFGLMTFSMEAVLIQAGISSLPGLAFHATCRVHQRLSSE